MAEAHVIKLSALSQSRASRLSLWTGCPPFCFSKRRNPRIGAAAAQSVRSWARMEVRRVTPVHLARRAGPAVSMSSWHLKEAAGCFMQETSDTASQCVVLFGWRRNSCETETLCVWRGHVNMPAGKSGSYIEHFIRDPCDSFKTWFPFALCSTKLLFISDRNFYGASRDARSAHKLAASLALEVFSRTWSSPWGPKESGQEPPKQSTLIHSHSPDRLWSGWASDRRTLINGGYYFPANNAQRLCVDHLSLYRHFSSPLSRRIRVWHLKSEPPPVSHDVIRSA